MREDHVFVLKGINVRFLIISFYVDPVGFYQGSKICVFLPEKPKMLLGRW
jgi:hypothetical protein